MASLTGGRWLARPASARSAPITCMWRKGYGWPFRGYAPDPEAERVVNDQEKDYEKARKARCGCGCQAAWTETPMTIDPTYESTARFYDAAYAAMPSLGQGAQFYEKLAADIGGPVLEVGVRARVGVIAPDCRARDRRDSPAFLVVARQLRRSSG